MLCLSRKKNESVIIADEIIVTVVEIRGESVRLAFEAPRDIPIHRAEVQARIDQVVQVNHQAPKTECDDAQG